MTRINTWIMVLAVLAASVTGESATLSLLEVADTSVTLKADTAIERVEHFVINDPLRLVVDLYGVTPDGPRPAIELAGGFRRLRSGVHPDKMRFVFEAAGTELPSFNIDKAARHVTISWQESQALAGARQQPAPREDRARVTLIEIVDAEDGASSALAGNGTLAPIANMWRHQVRISVQPFGGLNKLKHFLLRRPDRLVLELVGVVPGDNGRSFKLRDGFSRLDVDTTQQSARLVFEMGDGPLPGFDIIEAPNEERIVVAWGAPGKRARPSAVGAPK